MTACPMQHIAETESDEHDMDLKQNLNNKALLK
jgi:hypothetical protein